MALRGWWLPYSWWCYSGEPFCSAIARLGQAAGCRSQGCGGSKIFGAQPAVPGEGEGGTRWAERSKAALRGAGSGGKKQSLLEVAGNSQFGICLRL